MNRIDSFLEKLQDNTAVVGVVGLGYAGLPIVSRFLDVGFSVVGFDIDAEKIAALERGESYIEHIDAAGIKARCQTGEFLPTTDFSKAGHVDALLLCVPTPLNRNREPDLTYVVNTVETIIPHMRPGQLLSLESTTYPGTTEEVLRPRLEQAGFVPGEDVFLVYSPEREDPGNKVYRVQNTPRICGGCTQSCLEAGVALYEKIVDQVIPMPSTGSAEMTKILENTFRAVNIALVNELKLVSDRMGVDIFEVIRTAATKPFGYMPFYPGPGLGGHCIPIDPFYLTWKAREYGLTTRFIELAGEVNTSMPEHVVSKVGLALNSIGKPINGSSILVLGVSYKKNVDDKRESPSLVLIEKLSGLGGRVDYADPHVPYLAKTRKHDLGMKSIELTPEKVRNYDCLVLATDHDRFDWAMIRQNANLIVDTRGIYSCDDKQVFRA
ncbi:MAG: nucleotide sugar dehydrogenase [Desulfohalobiaceae bacterium]